MFELFYLVLIVVLILIYLQLRIIVRYKKEEEQRYYPVFNKTDIADCFKRYCNQMAKFKELIDLNTPSNATHLIQRFQDGDKSINEEKLKKLMRDELETKHKYLFNERQYRTMVEGNLAVLCGKKNIEQVLDEFRELATNELSYLVLSVAIQKELEEWEKRVFHNKDV